MRLQPVIVFFVLIIALSFSITVAAQPGVATGDNKQINIIQAERLNFQKPNDTTDLQSLAGNVVVRQEHTIFYCDSAVLNKRLNTLEAFGHVHINDADSVQTYADYLKYFGRDKKANLRNNVRLTDGKATLITSALDYDVSTKTGIYTTPGKLVNNETVLTSGEGYYYGETRDVYFKKNVVLVNPDYTVKTDTLLYNTYTDVATFTVPTEIISGSKRINTTDGYYDLRNKKSYFAKRPVIHDSTAVLIADEVANDDSTHFAEARGNVIYRDTAQGIGILSNNLKSNSAKGSLLATQNPVMIIKQDNDSLFIASDTLYSAKVSNLGTDNAATFAEDSLKLATDSTFRDSLSTTKQDTTSARYIEAYNNVRIFSDSLQAVGDSLFYSSVDSVFRLFKNPIVWSKQNQITGDTIYLYTKNKKPERLYVFENAMTISRVSDSADFFNQVKGRTINGYFKEGNIDNLRAKGNAESVYYATDEANKFIGVNKASSDVIDMFFTEKKPQKVVFRNNLKGTSYPMRQVNHEELKLRGFNWQDERRPKSKYDIFGT